MRHGLRHANHYVSKRIPFETLLSNSPLKSENTSRFQTALQRAKSIDVKAIRQKSASQYRAKTRVSASKFVALDTDKFGSIKKEWLDFPETTPDL